MPKMIVSIDGVVIKEVQLTKDRTTLGRRPYNDIVIDNLAVSGEHAVMQMSGADVFLEDLNSTNGTLVNGQPAKNGAVLGQAAALPHHDCRPTQQPSDRNCTGQKHSVGIPLAQLKGLPWQ